MYSTSEQESYPGCIVMTASAIRKLMGRLADFFSMFFVLRSLFPHRSVKKKKAHKLDLSDMIMKIRT